jgi:hypothetical protein
MEGERQPALPTMPGEQTDVGCFVSGGLRDDCERFVEDLKERLERIRQVEHASA